MVESSNTILLVGCNNKTLDFTNILDSSKSLILKGCFDLIITVPNKINKISIVRSKRIYMKVGSLISGLDIEHSNYVVVESSELESTIPIIDLYCSMLFLYGDINKYLEIKITSDRSEIHNLIDERG